MFSDSKAFGVFAVAKVLDYYSSRECVLKTIE